LLEESSCNETNVAAKMLDAHAAAKLPTQEIKHAQRNSEKSLLLLRFLV
jgi:hypothetical protein